MAGTGHGRRTPARGAALLTLLVIAACAPAAGPDTAPPDATTAPPPDAATSDEPAGAPAEPVPAPVPAPLPDAATPPDGAPSTVPEPCEAGTEAAVAGTVAAQLDALAVGDFVAAYAQASPFFRTLVDQDAFTAMIRTRYPELLDVAARRLEGCTVLNRRAVLVVAITASDGARRRLAYELGESDAGWRIDGAYDLEPPEPAPAAPQV